MVNVNSILWVVLLFGPTAYARLSSYWTARKRRDPIVIYNSRGLFVIVFALGLLLRAALPTRKDLFYDLDLHLRTSTEQLKTAVGTRYGPDQVLALQGLLERLGSFETRLLYAHFGQAPTQHCDWCRHSGQDGLWDYLFFTLPSLGLQYIIMLFVLGFASHPLEFRHWRTWGMTIVAAGFMLEVWAYTSVDIRTYSPEGTMLWKSLDRIRSVGFALLALSTLIFPSMEVENLKRLNPKLRLDLLSASFENLLAQLRFLSLHHLSVLSSRSLRQRKHEYEADVGQTRERELIEWALVQESDDMKEALRADQRLVDTIHAMTNQTRHFIDAFMPPLPPPDIDDELDRLIKPEPADKTTLVSSETVKSEPENETATASLETSF